MLKQKIQVDTTEALKKGEQFILGVLRMLLASILTKEKDKRYKISKDKPDLKEDILIKESELTDEQVIETISSEIKKRKDAIVLYEQGNRPELAEREKKEIEVLKIYLPEQLSEEQLKKIIKESIDKTGAKEMKDMGKVMADLISQVKGKADSGEVSRIIKELLSK
ncbi:MAG: GatB/YqeY domain-containing protein [Candidatus Staskawiczbacteria bacterium]